MTKQQYQEYLKTPHWQAMRAWALDRAGRRCQINGHHLGNLDVHHNNYDGLGAERPEDLIVLCRDCHEILKSRFPDPVYEQSSEEKHTALLNYCDKRRDVEKRRILAEQESPEGKRIVAEATARLPWKRTKT